MHLQDIQQTATAQGPVALASELCFACIDLGLPTISS